MQGRFPFNGEYLMNVILAEAAPAEQVDLAVERAEEIEKRFRLANLPKGFELDNEGVWFQTEVTGDDSVPSRIFICSPLEVTAIVRDHANENHGRILEFPDVDGHLHSWAMPMEMLAGDGTRYREELLNRGLLLSPGRKPRELLTQYIQLSKPRHRARCVLQTGWFNNHFVFPKETIGPNQNERLIYQSVSSHQFGYALGGTFEGWRLMSHLCQGNSRLVFAVSTAFASPLLHLMEEENGGFHFRGPSSIGKTTALRVAASVWGGTDYLQRWRATSNGLEGIANGHNDALLTLDEIEQMHPAEVGEVAYMLANGTGKSRSDKHGATRKKNSWRLLFLSTGEISLGDHMQQGGKQVRAGQEVRIIDIPADTGKHGLFEELHEFPNSAAFADHLKKCCASDFGHASRKFLKKLIQNVDENIEEVKKIAKNISRRYLPKSSTGQVVRAFNRFALIAAAGELATMNGVTGWELGEAEKSAMVCFDDWIKSRGNVGMQEERVALSKVRKFFEQHSESRFTRLDDYSTDSKTINRAGFRRVTGNDDEVEFFLFPETFKTEICAGLDHTFVSKVCIRLGILIPDAKGNATRSERLPGNGKKGTTRCYKFTSKVLESED